MIEYESLSGIESKVTANPSIKRTPNRLRRLSAAYLKRWANEGVTRLQPFARLRAKLAVHLERGGYFALGCAPFGLQRAVRAPRSIQAALGCRVRGPVVVLQGLQGKLGLFATLGAASHFFLTPPHAPNPAFERTAHGKPWSTAQGER